MTYTSKEDIISKYNITSSDDDEILKELKKIQKKTHPDTSQENNTNPDTITLFQDATDAINYISNLNKNDSSNNTLVIIDKMNELITNLNNSKQDNNQNLVKESFSNTIENYQKKLKSQYRMPKITSTTIVAIISFLWLFPNSISENPFLNTIINTNNFIFTDIWLMALIYLGLFWFIIKQQEFRYFKLIDLIQSEYFQENIFDSFKHTFEAKTFNKQNLTQHIDIILNSFILSRKYQISNKRFEHYIYDYDLHEIFQQHRFKKTLLNNFLSIDYATIDALSNVIIEKALATGIIQKYPIQSFSTLYTFSNYDYD